MVGCCCVAYWSLRVRSDSAGYYGDADDSSNEDADPYSNNGVWGMRACVSGVRVLGSVRGCVWLCVCVCVCVCACV